MTDTQKVPMTPDDAFKVWLEIYKLMWSRLQTMTIIEVAMFAGWYVLVKDSHPVLALALVTVVTALLGLLWWNTEIDVVAMTKFRERYETKYELPDTGLKKHVGRRSGRMVHVVALTVNVLLIGYGVLCLVGKECACRL
jgi:hypothetical protein